MKIAYRRMSGPIGTSTLETGTRGMWLEKRNALRATLIQRGHQVDYINRMTKFSQLGYEPEFGPKTHDLLFVEFGSSNAVFYKDDLERTRAMVEEHRGKVVFLCDDPDLPYVWKTLTKTVPPWTVWMNALYPQPFGGQPASISCFDAPFASLLEFREPLTTYEPTLAYSGRPIGRRPGLTKVVESEAPVTVYGRPKEWVEYKFPVAASPTQSERARFYSTKMGSLVLADAKHKRLGWRTGRAYHALYAGCPAVAEHDHPAMSGFWQFDTPKQLKTIAEAWLDPKVRTSHWRAMKKRVEQDREIMEATFLAHCL